MANTHEYDAFLSHAVEDKAAIANELNDALGKRDLKIWYSGQELGVGDSIINKINEGLRRSRFGIIIVSPTYMTKLWALTELNHFLHTSAGNDRVILPVFLNITSEELAPKIPMLADIFGLRAEKGVDVVADSLCQAIRNVRAEEEKRRKSMRLRWLVGGVVLALVAALLWYSIWSGELADRAQIDAAIHSRIENAALMIQTEQGGLPGELISPTEAAGIFSQYTDAKSRYRNEYRLKLGEKEIRAKKNVEAALQIDLTALTPLTSFGMDSVRVYVQHGLNDSGSKVERLVFENMAPVQYEIIMEDYGSDRVTAKVQYHNGIRVIDVSMTFPKSETDTKRFIADLRALPPFETYEFVRKDGRLELVEVR
jgi:hypothetical protein